ncbi:MAG: FkbM family methyltransferase [Cyclobacteriaceae bacterium]|jgi:FkbM family methyltransferase
MVESTGPKATNDIQLSNILGDQLIQAIDIGARGQSELPFMQLVPHKVKLIGFEPDAVACAKLNARSSSQQFFPYAIGQARQERDFYVLKLEDLSSLLPPSAAMKNRDPFLVKSVRKVSTHALDELKSRGLWQGAIDFVKLDTQGSELEILESGREVLRETLMVACETEFFEMYENQPRFSEVEQFMRTAGFDLLSLDHHSAWSTREGIDLTRRKITWADTVFVKSDRYFESLADDLRAQQVKKCAVLLASYGFFGEALRLMHKYTVPTIALQLWIAEVQRSSGSPIWRLRLLKAGLRCLFWPSFRNRLALARLCTQIPFGENVFRFTGLGKV